MKTIIMLVGGAVLIVLAVGCSKQQPTTTASQPGPRATSERFPASKKDAVETQIVDRDGQLLRFDPIYFEFDSSTLDEAGRSTLQAIASHLRATPRSALTIEGHCDERGTAEYNVALGERRAGTIRDYLVRLGIDGSRLSIISYGEERPAVIGSSEAAWSSNRRGEFVPGR
jgi:peptidoglycan-associated lipoprotein